MKLSELGFVKAAKASQVNKEKDYGIIFPGKVQVGDKKIFATKRLSPAHTYAADEPTAGVIRDEFKVKGIDLPETTPVYTDTTHVQTFRGKQQHVRHIAGDSIIEKHTSNIKNTEPTGESIRPIKSKDATEIKEDREYFAGLKHHGPKPLKIPWWQKIKTIFKGDK